MKRVLFATAAAAAAFVAGPAGAVASFSATINDLTVQLIDLDINDGIAPQLLLTGGPTKTGSVKLWGDDGSFNQQLNSAGLDPLSVAGGTPSIFGEATFAGDGSLAGLAITVKGTAGHVTGTSGRFETELWAKGLTFSLTANTQLVVKGKSQASAVVTESWENGLTYERASGSAGLTFRLGDQFSVGSFGAGVNSVRVLDAAGPCGPCFAPASQVGATDLEWTVRNETGSSAELTLYAHGGGFADSYVGVVPEPSTYALLLAGVGVVAFAVRRRRSV
jgi:PEP-CTERM motif